MEMLVSLFKLGKFAWFACIWLAQDGVAWALGSVLRQSHAQWLAQKQWQRRWYELTADVDYQLHRHSVVDDDPAAPSWLRVRNASSQELAELHLLVEATLGALKWQEKVSVYRLQPGESVHYSLQQIPTENLFIHQGQIMANYDTVAVRPLSLVRDGRREEFSAPARRMHPTYFDLLNGCFWKLGKHRYHLGAFQEACVDRQARLRSRWVGPTRLGWRSNGRALLCDALRRRYWRALPGIILFSICGARPAVAIWIWAAVILQRQSLREELDAEATKFVIGRGEGVCPSRVVVLTSGGEAAQPA